MLTLSCYEYDLRDEENAMRIFAGFSYLASRTSYGNRIPLA